ncbi:MAG: UvrD-helicase domain-containing protein, partial [Chloroflexi bacterium]|nr:UvrD-helicase domain-containing protein [Chloroflexota bacterium]
MQNLKPYWSFHHAPAVHSSTTRAPDPNRTTHVEHLALGLPQTQPRARAERNPGVRRAACRARRTAGSGRTSCAIPTTRGGLPGVFTNYLRGAARATGSARLRHPGLRLPHALERACRKWTWAGGAATTPGTSRQCRSASTLIGRVDLSRFTAQQRDVIVAGDGPLSILAGPGSGKTTTLAGRIAHLVSERDIPPTSILAITFTTAAAATLRSRLETVLGSAATRVDIRTFHSFGLRVIRTWSEELGFGHLPPAVYGREETRILLRKAATSIGLAVAPDRPTG